MLHFQIQLPLFVRFPSMELLIIEKQFNTSSITHEKKIPAIFQC